MATRNEIALAGSVDVGLYTLGAWIGGEDSAIGQVGVTRVCAELWRGRRGREGGRAAQGESGKRGVGGEGKEQQTPANNVAAVRLLPVALIINAIKCGPTSAFEPLLCSQPGSVFGDTRQYKTWRGDNSVPAQ
jgi:hypothetical protein